MDDHFSNYRMTWFRGSPLLRIPPCGSKRWFSVVLHTHAMLLPSEPAGGVGPISACRDDGNVRRLLLGVH